MQIQLRTQQHLPDAQVFIPIRQTATAVEIHLVVPAVHLVAEDAVVDVAVKRELMSSLFLYKNRYDYPHAYLRFFISSDLPTIISKYFFKRIIQYSDNYHRGIDF